MTYPPHPGQPPYDQQPGQGGYPPAGTFPQQGGPQPGQYPGQYPVGSPGGQYPSPGGFPPGYGPQPPKKKTGLWIGLSAAAVAVIAFVITAFLAPGFLLSDDGTDDNASANAGDGGAGNGDSSAEQVAQQLIDAANANNTATLTQLSCPDSDPDVAEVIGMAGQLGQVQLAAPVQESGNGAHLAVTFTAQGMQQDALVELKKTGNTWCWNNVAVSRNSEASAGPGAPGAPGAPDNSSREDPSSHSPDATALAGEAPALIEKFLDALNSGDKTTAVRFFCAEPDRIESDALDKITASSANLAMNPETEKVYEYIDNYSVELTGTVNGKEIGFGALSLDKPDPSGNFCIEKLFFAA